VAVAVTLDCVVGLGANLGDREHALALAVQRLGHVCRVVALSHLYENAAVGGPPQPDYLNGAVRLETELTAFELLDELLRLEQLAGRERRVKWGPRTLDLDLLWIDAVSLETDHLTVPHPRLLERSFALQPLVEVAPNARCPRSGRLYAAELAALIPNGLRLQSTASGPPWRWRQERQSGQQAAAIPNL
jgi:2-amino-4-hydroxy-6-hydroxymethyldihydropteridine diphosphokinase